MIVLKANQIRAWDEYTIQKGISSIDLMERAAMAAVIKLDLLLGEEDQEVLILCGNGNNGADGLAIARILLEMDYIVDVYVNLDGKHSDEWKVNYERLVNAGQEELEIHTRWKPEEIQLSSSGTIIDAMFGTGLSKPLYGVWLDIANWVNDQSNLTVAIDMPSGLYVDKAPDGVVVYADLVLTFQCQRLAFMMPESEPHYGEVLICNIGLLDSFLLEHEVKCFELTYYYLLPFLIDRNRFSHKGDFGHGYLIAGSMGMAGAAILSSAAAMRSGLGLLTTHVPEMLYPILQAAVPEAMAHTDPHQKITTNVTIPQKVTAIGVGPGLGTAKETISMLESLIKSNHHLPMVLDADALNILATRTDLLDRLPPGTIITPHPGEFDRLFGDQDDHYSRFERALQEAVKRQIIIVLKGGVTVICQSNGVSFFNTRGNPGMATGGSGDVLTGIILGLLGQGYSPDYAALLGVYIHATAGDLAAEDQGFEALIASDIVEYIGEAFEELRDHEPMDEEDEQDG